MGQIEKKDILIIFSYSGNTSELTNMLKSASIIKLLWNMLRVSIREMKRAVKHAEEYLQVSSIPQHVKQAMDASNSFHASPPALAGRRLGAIT